MPDIHNVKIEDTTDGYHVEFDCLEFDGLGDIRVRVILGEHDDAHLFAELLRRARFIGDIGK